MAIDIQFHLFNLDSRKKYLEGQIYSVNQLINVYDDLDKIGLPIYITEITVPGSGENGAKLQSMITDNLYRLWFSIKPMMGIA